MRTLDYAESLARFSALVDRRTGVVREVHLVRGGDADPGAFMAEAVPCDTTALWGIQAANHGAACSYSAERAVVRACGESVERYCAAYLDLASTTVATAQELVARGDRVLRPEELFPYTNRQYADPAFPFARSDGQDVRWSLARSERTGGPVRVPSSCVHVPYLFDADVEAFTHMPISTGLAAGPSRAMCIEKGCLEAIERDALMVRWYGRRSTPRIDPASCLGLSPEIDALLSAAPAGSRWYLSLLTVDLDVPVVAALLIDDVGRPMTSLGIAADSDSSHAILLALEEALLTRFMLTRSPELRAGGPLGGECATLRDHALVHAGSRDLRERMGFLIDDGPLLASDDVARRFAGPSSGLSVLLAAGFDVLTVDVTTEDVARAGFVVVRSIVPGLQPLDNDHRYRYLGGPRVAGVDPNPDPHPFP